MLLSFRKSMSMLMYIASLTLFFIYINLFIFISSLDIKLIEN